MKLIPYQAKIAVDFGSTNTVVAWKIYNVDANGNTQLSTTLNTVNNALHIPTVMVLESDNPDLTQDYFGTDATKLIRDANIKYVIAENFKQLLYNAPPESEEYRKGVVLTKKFFAFLLRTCQEEIIERLPDNVRNDMENTLFLSTPVRADPTHRALMRNIATEAGFNTNNKFVKICTDFDEARCVIHYAIENAPNNMAGVVAQANVDSKVLFVDVGGSTMDMALLRVGVNPAGKLLLDTISLWPSADEEYLLGGSLVDIAIRDYLIDHGFAVRGHTLKNWEEGDGKFRFRKLKEENNSILKSGNPITGLGMNFFPAICNPYERLPPVQYGQGNLITPDIFENVICEKYIGNMERALHSLFDEQRTIAGRGKVTAADVDAILISGAGSKLYFIKNIFLREGNGFEKIIRQPERLLSEWPIDSSLCCALGALVEQPENVEMPGYSRDDYSVKACLYILSDNIKTLLREHPDSLTAETKEIPFTDGNREKCALVECIFESGILELSKKFQKLPVNPDSFSEQVTYTDYNDGRFKYVALQLQMFRKNSAGELVKIGEPFLAMVTRNWKGTITDIVRSILKRLPDRVYRTRAAVQQSLNLTLRMGLSENYSFVAAVGLRGAYFTMGAHIFQMQL